MKQLLWKLDDALRFIHHPDHPVRSWALELMINRFPERAGDAVVDMLDDDNTYIVMRATDFLGDTGDRQRCGPALLEHLKQCTDERSGYYAEALGKLGYRQALPLIIDCLRPHPLQLKHSEFIRHAAALGALGGDEARQALWSILDALPVDAHALHHVADALLEAGLPDDVDRLVQRYRDWLPAPYRNRMLAAFASACNVDRLYDEMKAEARHGFNAMGRRAAEWLGQLPRLSGESLDLLETAFRQESSAVFDILSAEAQRLVDARGDDVAGWRAAWQRGESPPGYRRQALMTLTLLHAFAARPASRARVRKDENVMGFAMLCQLSVDRDDLAQLEEDDQAETLLAILSDDRQYVLPDIVERVAALGPSIAPRLIEMIDPDSWSWGMIRIIETIAQLARQFPGSCDEAVPLLVETVDDKQGDFLLEACETALVAIGPAAVGALAEAIRDDDISRQIYLSGALAHIPTERAARELIDWIESSAGAEEYQIEALKDIGHPAAIDLLYEWWEPGDYLLSEALLVLCEVNGIHAPELPEWRDDVAEQDEEIEQALSEARGPLIDLYPPDLDEDEQEDVLEAPLLATRTRRQPGQPKQRPAGKHREASTKEKKKHAAQKKKAKKKKK